ncbi:LysR family transcriptional regulator [Roseibacillus persicicus]|uniref:LysR family transcriptional regulator n=1 Tax=Roseibacillus persicicus TaxID=454148 RepID=UPI00398AA170
MSKSNDSNFKLETDLLALRSLIAVIDEGGFSAAARRVHRTQSAVSLQIAKLEERLGARLLERTSRSVSLTPAGETFASYARRILELADESMLAVTAPKETTLLRVGFADYLAPLHLHTLLARFRRAHPNCDLSLMLGLGAPLLKALREGDLDVVFAGPGGGNGTVLWEEPLVWTGPPTPKGKTNSLRELAVLPAPCVYRQLAFDALAKAETPWKVSIEANSVQAIQSAIRAGLGISILPLSAVQEDMPILKDEFPELPKTSVVSYLDTNQSHPYAQRFIDYLVASIEESNANQMLAAAG